MSINSKSFRFPMNNTEAVVGWVYLFVHTFALRYMVILANMYLFPALGFSLSDGHLNVVYYAFSFVFLLIFLFHYMKTSFADMTGNLLGTLSAVFTGYMLYAAASYLVYFAMNFVLDDLINPNSAAIVTMAKLNPNVMLVIGVLLAPVVEEVLFRGVVFGTCRKKSRFLAYALSALLFSVYHLWQYMLQGFSWSMVLYLIQYIPAGLVLGWCYERCRNIWGPVFLHMLINYVSITVTVG